VANSGTARNHECQRAEELGLDGIDLRILSELQKNGRIANNELSDRVGISPPPCLRRVRALHARGFIKTIRAILDEKLLGYEIVSFVTVALEGHAEPGLIEFEATIQNLPPVQECWLVSGEMDYLLKCVTPSITEMQALIGQLASMPNVRNVKSFLTLRGTKDAPLPLPTM